MLSKAANGCTRFWLIVQVSALAAAETTPLPARGFSVAGHQSIQEAIDSHPGRMIYVPPGDYTISDKIRIRTDHSGLFGPGRIVQENPSVPIVEIEGAVDVQLRDLTLARPEGKMDTKVEAVLAIRCRDLVLDNLRIVDNRTSASAIALRKCTRSQVRNCLVLNYMRIAIDDRTTSEDWGYAFRCIDGSGFLVSESTGTLLQSNRIIERHLLPTPQIKQQFQLGIVVKKNRDKGALVSRETWEAGTVNNWHQGSAIIVTSPTISDQTQILGNYIENAAQGIDIHADHVIVAQNIVDNAFIGLKAMHGSRHVLILGNQFSRNDLWGIGLMPGAASQAARPARAGEQAVAPNVDAGSIIANNIISDFGYGHAHWIWGDGGSPITLDTGQKPENPPLTDIIIQGNIVYDSGRDRLSTDAAPGAAKPRYRYAVRVAHDARGVRFANNILHPGTAGVSNVNLQPPEVDRKP